MHKPRGVQPGRAGATSLRRRAERRLKARPVNTRDARDASHPAIRGDPQRLIQELQVHQIELELQNEELQSARQEAESSLRRYTHLFEFAPIGYFVLEGDGRIRQVNFAAARLLNVPRWAVAGRRLRTFVPGMYADAYDDFLARVATADPDESKTCEILLEAYEGVNLSASRARNVQLVGTRLDSASPALLVAVEDVTAKKQAEATLRAECRRKDALIEKLKTLSDDLEIVQAETEARALRRQGGGE